MLHVNIKLCAVSFKTYLEKTKNNGIKYITARDKGNHDLCRQNTHCGGGLVAKSRWTLVAPCGLQPTRLLCPWDFPGKNADWSGLPFPFPGDLPGQDIEPRSPALQADSLLTEPLKNTTIFKKIDK